ncbi:serine threonine- kinase Nek4-like [Brachionus plicatilis]|uniref:non-specific serine/threonine protein kinase n=1 Tax=Brachionus plicatilis TaxID=10195 RepID=A0A3M7S7Q4_BRAPC|nr:serine threonine- kinase Nek4-like [Brachionus plicatilis]
MENYNKLKEIGKGSYGVVWLVKNIKDRKNYVLKRIDLRKSSDKDKKSAEQEAQILRSLKHPNIVSYKESFQTDGYLHIVMLFCEGGDLYTKIKQQNGRLIEESQIVEWFVQITMAIQYMHEKNILHRDLKTQNIFLTRNKIVKVGDLGIAKVLKSNTDMATTIIGTPYYMSPELFMNKPYNSKSDVWALGCCVYEMTTLKHAFNAKDMNSLVFKITSGKMPEIPKCYSSEFISLIHSMLKSNPNERPNPDKILRNPFIKKNIILFLDRTKKNQQNSKNSGEEKKESINEELVNNRRKIELVQERNIFINPVSKLPDSRVEKNENELKKNREKKSAKQVTFKNTPEKIQINDSFSDYDNEEHEPYELTKPKNDIDFDLNENEEEKVFEPVRPKSEPSRANNPVRIRPQIVCNSTPNLSKGPSQPKLDKQIWSSDPRERRRQRIRSSQNDPNSVLPRGPLLLKPPLNSKKSDNSSNAQNKNPMSKLDQDKGLQDSLKIFKQNNIENKIAPIVEKSNLYQEQKKIERDPFFPRKSSSSSSSSISSNDENDPVKQKLRDEKRERKDKRETDFLIDVLTVTLKSLVGINDQRDLIIPDLDDGDILEEIGNNSGKKSDFVSNHPKRSDSSSSLKNSAEKNSDNIINNHPISFLGANHMYKRIKETEEECERILGKFRLNQAYRILDSFKEEDEIQEKLINCIGIENLDCIDKLKMIKCFKERSNFGVR